MLNVCWQQCYVPRRAPRLFIRDHISFRMYFLVVVEPCIFPEIASKSWISLKQFFLLSVFGITDSPVSICLIKSSNVFQSVFISLSLMSENLLWSANKKLCVVLNFTCSWLNATNRKFTSTWNHLSWYIRRCRLCSLSEIIALPIPPRPYGKRQGNIWGYSCGLFHMDCNLSLWPTANIFSPEFRCLRAIALPAVGVMELKFSPVRPCTVNTQSPSMVPSSSSWSNTLVPSATLLVNCSQYSTETGGIFSSYCITFSCEILIFA